MRFSLLFLLLLSPFSLFAAIERDSNVVLATPSGKVWGTLTLPSVKTAVPVVLIISGSGPTNRDGNQPPRMRNNSLLVLADSLARRGIASLRYDKRGIGASKDAAPDESLLRFDDYVDDAAAWAKQLAADKRFSKVFIAGHSEGSLIGMLAAQRAPLTGYISISGVSVPADSIVIKQLSGAAGIAPSMVDSMRMFFGMLRRGERIEQVPRGFYQAILRKSVQPYLISWMKYNPVEEIAKVNVPTLIIQGNTDIQVDVKNAYALAAARRSSKLVIIPNMNHVLKELKSTDLADNQMSYIDPGFKLAKGLVPAIAAFVARTDKQQKR